jgi:hypothetical protein
MILGKKLFKTHGDGLSKKKSSPIVHSRCLRLYYLRMISLFLDLWMDLRFTIKR